MTKAKTKKQDNINDRVKSGYEISMYLPIMGQYSTRPRPRIIYMLHRHELTVKAVSHPHYQIRAFHWHHFISHDSLHGWQKALWKSIPVDIDISQWRKCMNMHIVIEYSYKLEK